eukprot:1220713-Prymnesium_polylepis.2
MVVGQIGHLVRVERCSRTSGHARAVTPNRDSGTGLRGQDTVIVAASAITGSLTRTQLRGLLGLHAQDVDKLPCRPFVTLRGRTCWLYGPTAVAEGLKINRTISPKKSLSRHPCGGCATDCKKSQVY